MAEELHKFTPVGEKDNYLLYNYNWSSDPTSMQQASDKRNQMSAKAASSEVGSFGPALALVQLSVVKDFSPLEFSKRTEKLTQVELINQ